QIKNLTNVMINASFVAIVGLGMTMAIASGNFDLSVGSTAAFAGVITMSLIPTVGVPVGLLAGLLTGAIVGLVNGLIITELRVPAFIATLGMMSIVRGLTLLYTDGKDIYIFGETTFKILSGGRVLGLPMPILLTLSLALLLSLISRHTRFGRHVLAIGSNMEAAHRAGVKTSRVLWGVFAIVSITAALSGLLLSSQVMTANGRLAVGLELSAIAVVVLGGTPLTGGRASFIGTLLGAVLIALINNGLNLLNVPIFWQELTVGALLLIALAFEMRRGSLNLKKLIVRT
ncbi:MAG: ABC transporter permease, partial [Chloroflexi bacterium]|nr:ABC transporter permease [Chloroflexota bacterium]